MSIPIKFVSFGCILWLAAVSFAASQSRVLQVPAQFKTIQAAIDAAQNTDTVLVAPGTYQENIDFKGKAIAVRSTDGSAVTRIHAAQAGSVVTFKNGEGPGSVIEGFRIAFGTGTATPTGDLFGGGVYCEGASPSIIGNLIEMNTIKTIPPGWMGGAGIFCRDGSPEILDNVIAANGLRPSSPAPARGCGILCLNSSARIEGNRITANFADYGLGGGIYCDQGGAPVITRNVIRVNTAGFPVGSGAAGAGIYSGTAFPTISSNRITENAVLGTGPRGGGIFCDRATIVSNLFDANYADHFTGGEGGAIYCNEATVTNNTFVHNAATTGSALNCGAGTTVTNSIFRNQRVGAAIHDRNSSATVRHCCVYGGWPGVGNIDADPLFVDKTDYHLRYDSPCRNKGTNQAPGLGQTDFEGDPRVADGNADMGADEFHPHLYHIGDVRVGSGHGFHVIGNPGTPTFWGVSMTVLDPPCTLPGIGGQLYLEQSRLAVIPVDMLPSTGHLFIPFALPQTFPEMKVPTQALIGLTLSNLDVVTVYK